MLMTIMIICVVIGAIVCSVAIFIQSQDNVEEIPEGLVENDVNIKSVDFLCPHHWKKIAQSRSAINNDILVTYICIYCDEIRTVIKN